MGQWLGDICGCADCVRDAHMSYAVGFVVGARVVFGVVVSPVFGASIPVITKLVLRSSAPEPPETHIHHFGPARDNSFVGDTRGGVVICLDRALWLWPSHGDEGLAVGNHFPCHDEKGCKFLFDC
jgi:hypothetical protein